MMTKVANIQYLQRSKKFARVLWFILRWWCAYGAFGGTIFLYSLIPFVPLFCSDCSPKDNLDFGNLIMTLFFSTGVGLPLGAGAGILLGGLGTLLISFWVYHPVMKVSSFRRRVILSNIAFPTGLLIFSTIFLILMTNNASELPTVLYIPVVTYLIVVIVGLLVSRKFIRWWLQDTAMSNTSTPPKNQ